MSDWIDDFCAYCSGIPSPDIFHLWTGISTLAAALERRVWVNTARSALYPNLFLALVAPPAVGKSVAISQAKVVGTAASNIARKKNGNGGFRFSPVDMTAASLIDALADSNRKVVVNKTQMFEYSSMYVAISELGVLMPGHELGFISILNEIFDNPENYIQRRRSIKDAINLVRPQINILAGTQPGFLAATLPETAWTMGFTSRLIMVYASAGPVVDLFSAHNVDQAAFNDLAQRLASMWDLFGEMQWEKGAVAALSRWHSLGIPPIPDHSRLLHYNSRRTLHLIKLCMVSAVSRGQMIIAESDCERAKVWLIDAEARMPDIFRDMAGKSDNQVIEELHLFMWRLWAKERRPIHESRMFDFLRTRLPSEKIGRVLEVAERSHVIARDELPRMWKPRPQHEHGME